MNFRLDAFEVDFAEFAWRVVQDLVQFRVFCKLQEVAPVRNRKTVQLIVSNAEVKSQRQGLKLLGQRFLLLEIRELLAIRKLRQASLNKAY